MLFTVNLNKIKLTFVGKVYPTTMKRKLDKKVTLKFEDYEF